MATTSAPVFRNLVCWSLFVYSNTTLLELQTLLFLFFPKSALLSWGCGLSTDAAYTRMFTVAYHLETETCFSLFDNLDLFSSGCFSCNGAGRFKREAAIIFKTPSTADVLILKLVTACCLRFQSQFTSVTQVLRFTSNEVTWYKFPPLSFFLLGTSCLGHPLGDVPCASEAMACSYWFSKWRTTKSIWVR